MTDADSRRGSMLTDEQRLGLQEVVWRYVFTVEDYRGRLYPTCRPEKGSPAWKELATLNRLMADEWSDEPISLTYGTVELHLRAAQDHVSGLAVLLGATVEDSLMTVARGATEAAARGVWLLSDGDGRDRVARCMTERLAGLRQEAFAHRHKSTELYTTQRIALIEESAERHGLRVTRRRSDSYIGDEAYPGPTRAVGRLFAHFGDDFGANAYADLSATAHSTVAAFAMRRPLVVAPQKPGGVIGGGTDVGGQESTAGRAVVIALSGYDTAFRAFLSAYGWSPDPWRAFVGSAHARMRALLGFPASQLDLFLPRQR